MLININMSDNIKFKIHLLMVLMAIFIGACLDRNAGVSCESLVPDTFRDGLNTVLQINAPSHINSFRIGESIFIVVDNLSDTVIEVAPDKDLKIFWWQGSSWSVARNGMNYLSVTDQLSPRTNVDPGGTIYNIVSDIPRQDKSVRVCVILEGIEDPDGSRSKVAAFTELILNP